MALNQMNEEFNDAFQTYFPPLNRTQKFLYSILTAGILKFIRIYRRMFDGKLLVNERVIEYPYIFQRVRQGAKVLDIGCVSSRLPIQLASLGHEVHGVDVQDYPFLHKNFHFHKEDIFQWNPREQFDSVILLSTIEHFGLGGYGDSVVDDPDARAIARIAGWVKPGGQMLVTTPFGRPGQTSKHRIYDRARLKRVFSDDKFIWKDERYFQRVDGSWIPSSEEKLRYVESKSYPVNGVIFLDIEKR